MKRKKNEVYREFDMTTMNKAAGALIALSLNTTYEELDKRPDGVAFDFREIAEVTFAVLCFMCKGQVVREGQDLNTALAEYVGEYLLNAVSAGPASIGAIDEIN